MLTIRTAAKPRYYVMEYYSEGGERPGRWRGKGAAALGLDGQVTLADLERIAEGRDPRTGELLVQIQRQKADDSEQAKTRSRVDHRWGFDVTGLFNKWGDTVFAVGDRELRDYLLSVHERGLDPVVDSLETSFKLAQRGKGGKHKELAKLVIAKFDHYENRNGDPLIHSHVVIANMCQRTDGSWSKLDSRALYEPIRSLGAVYRANVAKILRDELGFDLTPSRDANGQEKGWFEIEGVPRALVEKWSSRRPEIISFLEGKGIPLGGSTVHAKNRAARETRQSKRIPQTLDQMQDRWRGEAAPHGFSMADARGLFGKARPLDDNLAFSRAWTESLHELTKSDAYFPERLLVQKICERLSCGELSGSEIVRRVRLLLDRSPEVVRLEDDVRNRRFTTREMWECEQKVLGYRDALNKRPGAMATENILKRVLAKGRKLDAEGQHAVRTATMSDSAIRVISGVAGSGKTTIAEKIATTLRKAGCHVVGAGLTGLSKEELSKRAGIPSRTIESYLRHLDRPLKERFGYRSKHEATQFWRAARGKKTWRLARPHLTSKSVLILDEASLIDTRSMEVLLRHAVKAKATVILIGDPKQLPPIFAGMPMQRIMSTVPHAHLGTNRRQLDPADRKAVQWLRDGQVAKAFKSYASRGRVTVAQNKHDTLSKLVDAWAKAGGCRRPTESAIYVQTQEEAREVNRRCQERRLATAKTPHLLSVRNGDERYFRGDVVIFNAPARKYGGIENGFKGTVVSVDPIRAEIRVKLHREPQSLLERLTPNPVVTIPVRQFREKVSLGFALTTHRAQSQTVKNAFVLMGGQMLDREMAYVQLTRARECTRIFIDRSHAGEDFRDLITAVERSRPKRLAHDAGLHRERSLVDEREQRR